jgi:hypothetical protein
VNPIGSTFPEGGGGKPQPKPKTCDFVHTREAGAILFSARLVNRNAAMSYNLWTRKDIAFAAAIVALGCVAAVLTIGLAYPEPISNAALGPDWACSRIALVWTTCTRVQQAASAAVRAPKEPACQRPRT